MNDWKVLVCVNCSLAGDASCRVPAAVTFDDQIVVHTCSTLETIDILRKDLKQLLL